MHAIQLKQISHRFARQWALVGINLSIDAGRVVALIGPNGSGKTTLLRIMATLLEPSRGEGLLCGFFLQKSARAARSHIQWLGSRLGFYPNLSAKENLQFLFQLSGQQINSSLIDNAIQKVGLQSHVHARVGGFSSGMKKRLALARIIIRPTKLILLDEPHANLDQSGKDLLNSLIAEWKSAGSTLVMASHEHAETMQVADNIIYLDCGRIQKMEER